MIAKLPHHRLQYIAIAAICSLLGLRLKAAVKPQDCAVVGIFSLGRKNAMYAAKNSIFPVDERPVTIEGKNFKAAEVEHGRSEFFC